MKIAWVLLSVSLVACQDTDIKESEAVFEDEFHVKYGSPEDEKRASEALKKSEQQIDERNKKFKAGQSSFYEKLNEDSDVPREIFEKEKEGAIFPQTMEGRGLGAVLPPESEWYTSPELEELYSNLSRDSLPNNYDATTQGLVTPPRDQMSCGSCAAFAATGAHETCMLLAGARMNGLDLSEQMLIDCGYNGYDMNGCHGAHSGSYGRVFANNLAGQGPHEVTYPYLNTHPNLRCPASEKTYNSGAYVTTPLEDFRCDEDKLKKLVIEYGAAVSYLYASDRSFGNYANGVFSGCSSKRVNHAILVVGYGTENGQDYWLVKNSWGSSWGNNGMIKIKQGSSECGIGSYCYAAKCEVSSGSPSDPPVTPSPEPIPAQQECDLNRILPGLTGRYIIRFGSIESRVSCTNGICRPLIAGPSNACMYICGRLSCP